MKGPSIHPFKPGKSANVKPAAQKMPATGKFTPPAPFGGKQPSKGK